MGRKKKRPDTLKGHRYLWPKKKYNYNFQDLLNKYQYIFNITINAAISALKEKGLTAEYPRWAHIFYSQIDPAYYSLSLTRQDIEQELKIIYWRGYNTWVKNRPKIRLRNYLKRIGCFNLRNIINKHFSISMREFLPAETIEFIEDRSLIIPDLHYVAYGSNIYPWSLLNSEERYISYLYFYCGKAVTNIGLILGMDKTTAKKKFNIIIDKLKSYCLDCNCKIS